MVKPINEINPPPMPGIGGALLCTIEARRALERGELAWNKSQLRDALLSARNFINEAEGALNETDAP
jgi:hypothetical protein